MYTVTPYGFLIQNRYLLTDTPQAGYINLTLTKGSPMRYGTQEIPCVDFPGEYDIDGSSVVCFDAGGYLHYQIISEEGNIVLIQDHALLQKETVSDVTTWLCTNEKTKEAIERDELEGDIIVMTQETEEQE